MFLVAKDFINIARESKEEFPALDLETSDKNFLTNNGALALCMRRVGEESSWVSPIQYVPKKGGMAVVENEEGKQILTRVVTGWRVCIDYRKLNLATQKEHFPLPFIDQMLERIAGHAFYYLLDGYSGYNQIIIAPEDQEKITFTYPYGTFAYRRMLFRLCNALVTF